MKLTPKYVVLRVSHSTPYEWFGVLADGCRIYARARDGAWCVRVSGSPGEDGLTGREVATGAYNALRVFSYRQLKWRTKGLVIWPEKHEVPGDDQPGVIPVQAGA